MAAIDNRRRFSIASFSRRALVFEEPLGATPVRILVLSLGVKLTKSAMPLPATGVRGAISERLRLTVRRFATWKVGDGLEFGDGEESDESLLRDSLFSTLYIAAGR